MSEGNLVSCTVHRVYFPVDHPRYAAWLHSHRFCALTEYSEWADRMLCWEDRGPALHLINRNEIPDGYTCPLSGLELLAYVGQVGEADD